MTFAKYTFIGAGIWGLAVLLPFYALIDITGRHYATQRTTRSSSGDSWPSPSPGNSGS